MRRCGATVMVALVMAGSIAACGGSSASSQVKSTITTFLNALANDDANTACAQLTSSGQKSFATSENASSCAAGVKTLIASATAADKSSLKSADIIDITVNGNSATAMIKGGTGKAKLTKVNGKWLIANGGA